MWGLGLGRRVQSRTGTRAWACTRCSPDAGPFPARPPQPARPRLSPERPGLPPARTCPERSQSSSPRPLVPRDRRPPVLSPALLPPAWPRQPHSARTQGARCPTLASGSGQWRSARAGGQGHLWSPAPATWKFPFTWSPGLAHGRATRTRGPRAEGRCHAHRRARVPLAMGRIRSCFCLLHLPCSRGQQSPRWPVRRRRGRDILSQGRGEPSGPIVQWAFSKVAEGCLDAEGCPRCAQPEPARPPKLAARSAADSAGFWAGREECVWASPAAAPSCPQGRAPGRRTAGSGGGAGFNALGTSGQRAARPGEPASGPFRRRLAGVEGPSCLCPLKLLERGLWLFRSRPGVTYPRCPGPRGLCGKSSTLPLRAGSSQRQTAHTWTWLCSNKTLLTQSGRGPDRESCGLGGRRGGHSPRPSRPLFRGLWSQVSSSPVLLCSLGLSALNTAPPSSAGRGALGGGSLCAPLRALGPATGPGSACPAEARGHLCRCPWAGTHRRWLATRTSPGFCPLGGFHCEFTGLSAVAFRRVLVNSSPNSRWHRCPVWFVTPPPPPHHKCCRVFQAAPGGLGTAPSPASCPHARGGGERPTRGRAPCP